MKLITESCCTKHAAKGPNSFKPYLTLSIPLSTRSYTCNKTILKLFVDLLLTHVDACRNTLAVNVKYVAACAEVRTRMFQSNSMGRDGWHEQCGFVFELPRPANPLARLCPSTLTLLPQSLSVFRRERTFPHALSTRRFLDKDFRFPIPHSYFCAFISYC